MVSSMTALGIADGIAFNFGEDARVGPTLDAHRILWLVREDWKLQNNLAEQLFIAYHEHGENPADYDVLLRCAERAGLDSVGLGRVEAFLRSSEGTDEVRAEIGEATDRWHMLLGVPHFHVLLHGASSAAESARGRPFFTVIPGAQDVSTIAKVLQKL